MRIRGLIYRAHPRKFCQILWTRFSALWYHTSLGSLDYKVLKITWSVSLVIYSGIPSERLKKMTALCLEIQTVHQESRFQVLAFSCSYFTKHNILYKDSLQHQHLLMDCVCKIFKIPLHITRAIAVPGMCVCVSPSQRFAVVARVLICGWEASLKRQTQWQKRK